MPQGAAARALLGVMALITIIALAVAPVVDARPKDKKNNGANSTEVTSDASGDVVSDDSASQTTGNGGDERTLLSSDADGDYIPDSLDNCSNVQNPDQADSDGDGAGDACPIAYDTDGDGVADKDDNCPGVATSDFRDTDGDGVGDPCDKSPDGVEPEPVQVADYVDQGEPAPAEPETVNGANQDGQSIERAGRDRSRQRSRTETSDPVITTGADTAETADGVSAGDGEAIAVAEDGLGSEGEIITEGPDAQPYEPSGRDNPRRNEELIAEAAASGDLYAEPQPPPAAQRAWDENVQAGDWQVVARIDSGADVTESAQSASATDTSKPQRKTTQSKNQKKKNGNGKKKKADKKKNTTRNADAENGDAAFARGWALAAVRLQDDVEPGDGDPGDDGGVSPVPVENGLVLSGGPSQQTGSETAPDPAGGRANPAAGRPGDDGAQLPGRGTAARRMAAAATVRRGLPQRRRHGLELPLGRTRRRAMRPRRQARHQRRRTRTGPKKAQAAQAGSQRQSAAEDGAAQREAGKPGPGIATLTADRLWTTGIPSR